MKLIKLTQIHKGSYLSYYVADYENDNGDIKQYELISRDHNLTTEKIGNAKPAGVGMVVYSRDKTKVLLESEFRLATNHFIYNFPAGLIDKGETAEQAAERELREETGTKLIDIEAVLPPSYALPGISDEFMQIVICRAEGEILGSDNVDEEIHTRWYTKDEIKALFDQGAHMSVRTQMFLWQWINEK